MKVGLWRKWKQESFVWEIIQISKSKLSMEVFYVLSYCFWLLLPILTFCVSWINPKLDVIIHLYIFVCRSTSGSAIPLYRELYTLYHGLNFLLKYLLHCTISSSNSGVVQSSSSVRSEAHTFPGRRKANSSSWCNRISFTFISVFSNINPQVRIGFTISGHQLSKLFDHSGITVGALRKHDTNSQP